MNKEASVKSASRYHSFLEDLRGNEVTIYRGGPESRTGKLVDVQSDYITLCVDNDNNSNNQQNEKTSQTETNEEEAETTIIYYQANHVKSISENTKVNSIQAKEGNEGQLEYIKATNFIELLGELKKETVRINQGGPESKYGDLLSLSEDHIVLWTEDDGIVFYNVHHIKSISKYEEDEDENENIQETRAYPEFVLANNFHEVIQHLSHKWVAINRGGPEAMEGVLVKSEGGHYTIVRNEEVLRVHPFHIRNISTGPRGFFQQKRENENNTKINDETFDKEVKQLKKEDRNRKTGRTRDRDRDRNSDKSTRERDEERERSRRSSSSRATSNEKVLESIDYVWRDNEKD